MKGVVGGRGSVVSVWSSSFSLLYEIDIDEGKLKLELHTLTPDP